MCWKTVLHGALVFLHVLRTEALCLFMDVCTEDSLGGERQSPSQHERQACLLSGIMVQVP